MPEPVQSSLLPRDRFAPTAWTVVGQARTDSADPSSAWDHIYRHYWQPVCSYLCRQGQTKEQAEETTQKFFAWLWEKDILSRAERSRGKFRNFLLTALKQFVARDRRYHLAAKRNPAIGGGNSTLGLPASTQYVESVDHQTVSAERQFDRACALELLQLAVARLRDEYHRVDQEHRFEVLHGFLTGEDAESYESAATKLGLSVTATRMAVHRLRKRYGQLLREEIQSTVESAADVDDEISALFQTLRARG